MELNVLRAVETEHQAYHPQRVLDTIVEGPDEDEISGASCSSLSVDDSSLLRRRSLHSELVTADGVVVMQTHRFRRHYRSLLQCISRNFGKGFVLGLGAKGVLGVLYGLLSLARGKRPALGALVGAGGLDYGMYFGSVLSAYNTVMYVTRFETGLLHHFRGALAGALAGAVSSGLAPAGHRQTIALFFLVRGIELQVRMWVRRRWLPAVPHADTLLMMATSAEVMWAWLFRSESLDPSYLRFLNHHGQKNTAVLRTIDRVYRARPLDRLPALNAARAAMGAAAIPASAAGCTAHLLDPTAVCELVHPGQSCSAHFVRYFANGWRLALPVYLPVYAVPMLLFNGKRLATAPLASMRHLLQGVALSATFLSAYTSIGFGYICTTRRVLHPSVVGAAAAPLLLGLGGGAVCGLANFAEKRSRRIELALYVLTHALRSAWAVIKADGVLPAWLIRALLRRGRGEALMMSYGMMMVMHAFVRHPQMLRRSYFGLCVRLFDSEDHRHALFGKSTY
eukprot:g7957.t1